MLIVGLTGNIASGKSTVARRFASHGASIIDADTLAREAVEPGRPALAQVAARWGPEVLDARGALDRAALRQIVFGDPAELEALNAIIHPAVAQRREALIAEARSRGDRVVIADIPLLFEAGLDDEVDTIVLVDAPSEMRRARLLRDRGLSEPEAEAMIAAQMPASLKRARADQLIENTGTLDALASRTDEVWEALSRDPRAQPESP
jgi:dephospho-CoA kinase